MMSLTKSDFGKICRICLKQPNNLISILKSEILNMFHTCTKIKIENNEFPKNICLSCLGNLNTAYTFHQQCERSDNILHQIVEYDDKSQFLAKHDDENQMFIENDANDLHESKEMIFEENNLLNDSDENNSNDTQNEWESDPLQESELEMSNCQKSTPRQEQTNDEEFSHLDKLVEHTETNHEIKPAHAQIHDQLTCHDCGRTFLNMPGLKKHRRMHLNGRSLTCSKCFKTFTRSFNLRTHQRRVHKTEIAEHTKNSEEENQKENEIDNVHESKEIVSEENNILVDSDEEFSPQDKLVDSNVGSLTCQICFKTYSRSNNLRRHQRTIHKIQFTKHTKNSEENQIENEIDDLHESKEIVFEENKISVDSDEKFSHLDKLVHSNGQSLTCKICFKIFTRSFNLRRHQRGVHKIKIAKSAKKKNDCQKSPYRCETNHKVRTVDMQNHKRVNCRYCDKTFMSRRELRKHYNQVHWNDGSYICTECSKTFFMLHLVKRHLKGVHKIIWRWKNHVKLNRQKCNICQKEVLNLKAHKEVHLTGDNFKCEKCSKYFVTEAKLKFHTRQIHEKRYVKPALCSVCGIEAPNNYFLDRHMRIHTGEKPFKCDKCDKSFTYKCNFVKHKAIHSDARPFICKICPKRFKTKVNLKKHMFLHTGKRPHVCHICSKSFSYRNNLRRHMRVH